LNCRRGYDLLLQFCDENNIKYDICGKIIVAASENELSALYNLLERGKQNGLKNLKELNTGELKDYEPHVRGIRGIHVPQTGIIDFREVADKMYSNLIEAGVEFRFNESVNSIKINDEIEICTNLSVIRSTKLINCGGLYADKIAAMTEKDLQIRLIPFRGEYYKVKEKKRDLIKNLIYPVPDPEFPFLGVHFTRMINGEVEAGPNAVFSFKREGYNKFDFSFSDTLSSLSWPGFRKIIGKYWKVGAAEFYRSYSKNAFVKALQQLVPSVNGSDLEKGGAGVRAQACDINGKLLDDFYIIENRNVWHVCNAPSPAATASLAIGEHIAGKTV
jgi:L-2-hydroxyglutarate oxidase